MSGFGQTPSQYTEEGKDWGYVIHWIGQDGHEQSKAFPAQLQRHEVPLAGLLHAFGPLWLGRD